MTCSPFALVSALLLPLLGVAPSLAQVVQSEFIYDTAPYPSCHASTIEQTEDGLVAAWFGGTREKHPDVGIWCARHINGAWTTPVEVANGVQSKELRYPCWNPVLFQPRLAAGGQQASSRLPLMLFYKVGPDPESWWGMLMTSDDGGSTWSEPIRLPGKIVGPIKNKPIQLANGDILCGTSSEDQGWRVHVERSGDLGKTWQASEPLNDGKTIGAIQPSFLTHGDSTIQAIGRTRDSDKLYEIWSQDGGRSWGEMKLTELPNPNSGTDALTLADGRHLLVYNHSTKHRWPLNVSISADGKQWDQALVLESSQGEFSYPAVIQTADNKVHVTYTWNRKKIRHVVIDPEQL
ncbi:MAG: sialidase family protein [Planctomycetaceae bacterium]